MDSSAKDGPLLVDIFICWYRALLYLTLSLKYDCSFQDEANESRMRAACLIEEAQRLLDRQSGLYSVYSDAIHKFKSSKDSSAFANARKKLDGDYRSISNQISQVMTSLSKEQPGISEKVRGNNTNSAPFEQINSFLWQFSSCFFFFSLGSARKCEGSERGVESISRFKRTGHRFEK